VASIVNEVESISAFIEPLLTGEVVYYQQMPIEPKANDLSIRYIDGGSETETAYHYRLDRNYQIVYFADKEIDCMQGITKLEQKFNNEIVIPLKNSTRYLRVDSFSFSRPFKTEGGKVFAIMGLLSVNLREARSQKPVSKINYVTTRVN
jgi:hypothetical protein